MTVERMCQLGGISRSGFYRMGSRSEAVDRDVELRDAIQRIAVEFPQLWSASNHGGAEAAGLVRKSEAGVSNSARG